MVFAPLEVILAQLLFFRIAILGRYFLPCLILFLMFLVRSVLFILLFALVLTLVFLFLSFAMALSLGSSLSWPLRALILAALATGAPLTRILEIVEVGLHKGHKNFVGQGECPIDVAVMLLLHVGFEVVAGNDEVGIEEEVEWVVDGHPSSQNL